MKARNTEHFSVVRAERDAWVEPEYDDLGYLAAKVGTAVDSTRTVMGLSADA